MQVKCVICDIVESLQEDCLEAKRLRNRRVNLYLCKSCHDRIAKKTEERQNSGHFNLYKEKKNNDRLI